MTPPILAALGPSLQQQGPDVWEFAEAAIQRTAGAIHQIRAASPQELTEAISLAREQHAAGKPADLIEVLVRAQGHEEENVSAAYLELADQIAHTHSPYAPVIPFAGKLMTPASFYESFDHLHEIARVLLSPIIYAEDTDAIGIASANPLAASLLAEEVRNAVFKRFGIRPFVTISRLDYESWKSLTHKHFER